MRNLMIGIALMCSFQMSFAAAGKSFESVRESLLKTLSKVRQAAAGRPVTPDQIRETADQLSKFSEAEKSELSDAIQRPQITIKEPTGDKTFTFYEISRDLVTIGEALSKVDRNSLDANAKTRLDLYVKAVQFSGNFLSLGNKTSAQGQAKVSEQTQMEIDAYNKQVSLIPDLFGTMTTAEIQSHLNIMDKAYKKRTGPEVPGDRAYAEALHEGKSREQYLQKLKDILGCIRG